MNNTKSVKPVIKPVVKKVGGNSNVLDVVDYFIFFKVLLFFSPIILLVFMFGAALMSGSPFVFMLYVLFVFGSLMLRYLLLMMIKMPSQIGPCKSNIYFPFVFNGYKEFMSTFLFAFTIAYIFGPAFGWKSASENSIMMFVFLIMYAVYDLVVRFVLLPCIKIDRTVILSIIGNIVIGMGMGLLSQFSIQQMKLSGYLYYGHNVNRPTKKIFKCGKIQTNTTSPEMTPSQVVASMAASTIVGTSSPVPHSKESMQPKGTSKTETKGTSKTEAKGTSKTEPKGTSKTEAKKTPESSIPSINKSAVKPPAEKNTSTNKKK